MEHHIQEFRTAQDRLAEVRDKYKDGSTGVNDLTRELAQVCGTRERTKNHWYSTVSREGASLISRPSHTVEPPNKGHFGSGDFVLYLEAVLWWEVRITTVSTRVIPISAIASVLYIEVVLWWEGPL